MNLLAIDVGSSSVKSAILRNGSIVGDVARVPFDTRYEGVRVEVDADEVLRAVARAIKQVGPAAKKVDCIGLTVMAPSWCAIDKNGNALTPLVTHQDRRSVEVARELERRLGKARHLKLAGNRPFPGGISSTTWAWYLKHAPGVMKKADLCGHLNTLLHRVMTHSRVTDPSNASFMGFYDTLTLGGWNDELIENVGIKTHRLPQVIGAEEIGGLITRDAGRRFGLTHGTPMLVGCMDGSAAALLAGNKPGTLVNVCGSTDVLALVTDKPRPHENLLTRAVGVDNRWVSVSTMAAAGSALEWAHDALFKDLSVEDYRKLIASLATPASPRSKTKNQKPAPAASLVQFDNHLAGSRTSLEQKQASFTGLTLSTSREQMLSAIIESLARDSAARIRLLQEVNPVKINRNVVLTGGVRSGLHALLTRDWPGSWTFTPEDEATLRGVGTMVPKD